MDSKMCAKCEIEKPIDDFPLTKAGKVSMRCERCRLETKRVCNQRWATANPEKAQESTRRYREARRDALRESGRTRARRYRENCPEQARDAGRRYDASHRERRRLSALQRYYAYPGKMRAKHRLWRIANPNYERERNRANPEKAKERNREKAHRRRARIGHGVIGPIRPLAQMVKEQKGKCYLCGKRFTKRRPATIEHYVPLSKGGAHANANTLAAHRSCNSRKQSMMPNEFAQRMGRLLI